MKLQGFGGKTFVQKVKATGPLAMKVDGDGINFFFFFFFFFVFRSHIETIPEQP